MSEWEYRGEQRRGGACSRRNYLGSLFPGGKIRVLRTDGRLRIPAVYG